MNEEDISQYNDLIKAQIRKAGGTEAWKQGLRERASKGGRSGTKHFTTLDKTTLQDYQKKSAASRRTSRGENT